MMRRFVLLLALVLVASACGDDDSEVETDGSTSTTESEVDGTEPADDETRAVQPTDVAGLEIGLSPTEFDPPVDWSVTVFNTTDEALTLEFSSGQRADLSLLGEGDSVLYTWSASRSFVAALGSEQIPAGESVTFTLDGDPLDLEPGAYTAVVSVPASEPLMAAFAVEIV